MAVQPVAVGLVLCDQVIVEERTRKASLIGTFAGIRATSFPALADPFSVFAVLTDGSGDVTISLVVSRLDTGENFFTSRSQLSFSDPLAEVQYHLRLKRFLLPAPGHYQFTLLADGEWVAHRRIRVYSQEEQA
jgi:hypothetical protein